MTKPIHPSVAIACGDLLQHAMWVTGCSDQNMWVDYSGHVGWLSVKTAPKDDQCYWTSNFRIVLDESNPELIVNRVQTAIDMITVHRGKCLLAPELPLDGERFQYCDPELPF